MPAASIEIVIIPRWTIVLAASAMVFAVAISWIFVPQRLRTWVSLSLVTVFGALAIAYPIVGCLVAEASVLGILAAAPRHGTPPSFEPLPRRGHRQIRAAPICEFGLRRGLGPR